MRVLKQSTAVTVLLGPFVDKTDGVTEEVGLATTGTEISKAGGAFAAGPTLGTHDSDGWYPISLTTTHTNTLGDLTVKVHDAATHLPVWVHFTVLPANAYDALVSGTGVGVRADVEGIGADAQSATDLKDFADAGYDPATNKVQGVVLVDTLTTHTGNTVQTGDSFARLGAPAGVSIAADLVAIEAQTDDIGVAGAGLTALGDVRLANLDAAVTTRLATAGYTAPDNTSIAAILVDTAEIGVAGAGLTVLATQASVNTIDDLLDTEVAAIKAKTDSLTFTVAGQVDSNVQSVNDVTIVGNGAGTPFNV